MLPLLVSLIVALATFTQAVTGFGLALVSMPLLVSLIGIQLAAPLVALVGIASQLILMVRYRQRVAWRAIIGLAVGSIIGIPLGVLALRTIDEQIVTLLLGVVILGYVAYSVAVSAPPRITGRGWELLFGLAGGLLTGAYNSGGPPLVIYGSSQRWPPLVFKGNIQALLVVHSVTVITAHAVNGGYTAQVFALFAVALPALLIGTLAGFLLDRYINARVFHRLILALLVILGLRLIAGALNML